MVGPNAGTTRIHSHRSRTSLSMYNISKQYCRSLFDLTRSPSWQRDWLIKDILPVHLACGWYRSFVLFYFVFSIVLFWFVRPNNTCLSRCTLNFLTLFVFLAFSHAFFLVFCLKPLCCGRDRFHKVLLTMNAKR